MSQDSAWTGMADDAIFDEVLAAAASRDSGFALLHRPTSPAGADRLDVLIGGISVVGQLADIPLAGDSRPGPAHDLLVMLPYRQITERGFACRDDSEPIWVMSVRKHGIVGTADAISRIPEAPVSLQHPAFSVDDGSYADTVKAIIADEIGSGAGSNFVIRRDFTGYLPGYTVHHALAIFRRLLLSENGAHWTFLIWTPARTFIGATPERHVSLRNGVAVMNPISGTCRYPDSGPRLPGVVSFLADRKEADELNMVVDEELKMMAKICDSGGTVDGPYLKEMGRLAHTEYFIKGHSSLDVRAILRETMFAPTVTGSPIENACRVIAQYENGGRAYYSGVAALIGRDGTGRDTLDSAILIRSADISVGGQVRIGVGATLVRLSDPDGEAAETTAKAAAMLGALGCAGGRSDAGPAAATPRPGQALGNHPAVQQALDTRNGRLAGYWFQPESARARAIPALSGRKVLVVDAEDTFTAMLGQHLRSLGLQVFIDPYHDVRDAGEMDLVIAGPGPGDPRDASDARIAALRQLIRRLIGDAMPFFAVCLGHQVLSSALGLEIVRNDPPHQGMQREIRLFGRTERVGLYNTFSARCDRDTIDHPSIPGRIEVSRDPRTGEVHALRCARFASVQFHPESLLTQHGSAILTELVTPLVREH